MESQQFLVKSESIFSFKVESESISKFLVESEPESIIFKHTEPKSIFYKRLNSLYPVVSTEQQHKLSNYDNVDIITII